MFVVAKIVVAKMLHKDCKDGVFRVGIGVVWKFFANFAADCVRAACRRIDLVTK